MPSKYGLERSRQITAEAPEPLMVRRSMQKGDFKLGPHMTEMQGERIIELLEDLVSLCQENLDQVIAQELKHHNASYPSAVSHSGENVSVSYPSGH